MGIVNNALIGASGNQGYNLQRSLRFRSSASAYLKRTLTGVSITKLSYSVWTKRGALGSDYTIQGSLNNASNYFLLGFNSSDQLDFQIGGTANRRRTTQVFRDPSAWYHIYLVLDTTQATADNRIKMYVNGVQVTAFATNTTGVAQNANLPALSTTMEHDIGGYNAATAGFFYDGYLAEYYYLEGQALDVSSFGSTNTLTGVWQPARYTGTFTGTNSCYLPFNPASASTYAASLNGSSQYASLPATSSLVFGTGDFTFETFVNFNSLSSAATLWTQFGPSNNAAINVYWYTNNTLRLTTSAGSYDITSVSWTPTVGTWYHVAICKASGTIRFFINGVVIGTVSDSNSWGVSQTNYIGKEVARNNGSALNGYLSNMRICNVALYTAAFSPPTSALTAVSGTQLLTMQNATLVDNSTNAFTLTNTGSFSLATAMPFFGINIAADASGNGNNWLANNISLASGVTYDSMTDVPTLTSPTAANFAVLNPLDCDSLSSGTISNGNLYWYGSYVSKNGHPIRSTFRTPSSGKWYTEARNVTVSGGGNSLPLGFTTSTQPIASASIFAGTINTFIGVDASVFNNNVRFRTTGVSASLADATTLFATYASGDVINLAIDLSSGKFWAGKNGTWYNSGDPAAGTNATSTFTVGSDAWTFLTEYVSSGDNSNRSGAVLNFGQQGFSNTPPSGFVALNTYNLPTSTIVNGAKEMGILLYTGDGTTSKDVTGLSFQPDLTYVKNRSAASDPTFSDTLRGITKVLYTDATSAESTAPSFGYINSILSTGFNVNSGGGTEANFNKNGQNYVGWTWKAGQGTTSSNTSGTITSTVSVNASAGFSVVTFTAPNASAPQSFGHGLGVAPAFFTIKARNTTSSWQTYHTSIGATNRLLLNTTDAQTTTSGPWNNTAPTSTVITIGSSFVPDAGATTYVAYCWTPIAGYSAFGSYTGNGSTDGPFVYTGFRPRWIMVKVSSTGGYNWVIVDTARNEYNPQDKNLYPNLSASEDDYTSTYPFDILSNGFKPRANYGNMNLSGATIIYAAFAEVPFKNSLAR